jgi:hypothetical protein
VPEPIPLGIYVLVEQVDRRFLASNFGEASKDSLLMKPEVKDWRYINEAFGTFTMLGDAEDLVQWDIDRPWVGRRRLLERLFASEDFPKLYRAALAQLMKQAFTGDLLFDRIAEFEKVLSPHVAKADKLFWLNGSTLKQKPARHLEAFRMAIDGDPAGFNRAVRRKILSIKPFALRRIESIKAQLAGKSEGKTLGRRK